MSLLLLPLSGLLTKAVEACAVLKQNNFPNEQTAADLPLTRDFQALMDLSGWDGS